MTEEISVAETTEAAPAEAAVDASVEPKEPGEEDAKAEEKPPEPPKEKVSVSFRQRLEFEKRRVALERERNAEKARADKAHAALAKLKENPFEGLKEAGTSYEEITRSILGREDLDPAERRVQELERRLALFEEQAKKHAEEVQSRTYWARVEATQSEFLEALDQNEDKYPTLVDHNREELKAIAWRVIEKYEKDVGEPPSNEEVLEYLEELAATEAKAREERRAARLAKKAPPLPAKTNGAPKTLSHAQTGEKAFFPPDMDKLPEEEQQRLRIEYLRQHMRQRSD